MQSDGPIETQEMKVKQQALVKKKIVSFMQHNEAMTQHSAFRPHKELLLCLVLNQSSASEASLCNTSVTPSGMLW